MIRRRSDVTIKTGTGETAAGSNGSTPTIGIDIPELSAITGLSESLLYSQANAGKLPGCRRIGRRYLVHVPTFERWLADGWGDEV
jgi:predicted DNA-binding transcriptional regulator AlpA